MNTNHNISELFFAAARKYPHRLAIIHKNHDITFCQLAEAVECTANYFHSKGIKKGDRVLVFVPMSIDLYRIVLALFSMGATAVFLDEWVNKKRMEECCKVVNCDAFIGIFKARVLAWFSYELRKIPIKLGVKGRLSGDWDKNRYPLEVERNYTALITFTTGSTGIPKAAKRTHHFLSKQFEALNDKLSPEEDDVDLTALPIVLFMNLGNGVTSVIPEFKASRPDKMDPSKITRQIQKHQVTRIIASPFIVKRISLYLSKNNLKLQNIRKIFTGGAPVFPHEAELYKRGFPDMDIEIVYGSTEAEPISSIKVNDLVADKDFLFKTGLNVGSVYQKAEVKIINITDEAITVKDEIELQELPHGSIGEIIVRGDHVLTEYIKNPQAIKKNKIFINEKCWHRTGDSGYLNESGVLYLTGRCNMIIEKDGRLISPFLYENYFQSLPGVNIGTILMIEGKIVFALELWDHERKKVVLLALESLPVKAAKVAFLKKIPRDLRHHSKIDYSRLLQMLD
ncbi:MAG TPA: AMP-binding protein [Cytophagaceae bacterium]